MRVLVAEDDAALRRVLEQGLREAGYVVDAVSDGIEACRYLGEHEFGAVILDWRMPGLSGVEVVAWARQSGVRAPILMLTARDASTDRIGALDEGADDYLVKPFDFGELLARLRALQRRPLGDRSPIFTSGLLAVNPSTREARIAELPVKLTPREFAILELLIRKSPAVVQRRTIALQAWAEEADAVGSNTIEVHVARLRAKLVNGNVRIETVRGAGYRLVAS
jgi:DNA-binding response OmpR family regulator